MATNNVLRLQLILSCDIAIKKTSFFLEFSGILESFWRILDISKKDLSFFSGTSEKNFRPYFGNYVAKPSSR